MKSRIVHTKFWSDPYVRSLDGESKYFYFYLLTNEFVNILNIIEASLDVISIQTALSVEKIETILKKLEFDGKIKRHNHYILLCNAFKYQTYTGVKNNYSKLRLIYEMSDDLLSKWNLYVENILFDIEEECRTHNVIDEKITNLLKRVKYRLHNTPIYTPISMGIDTRNKSEIKNHNSEFLNQNSESLIKKERELLREKTMVSAGFTSLDRTFFSIVLFLLFLSGVVFFPKRPKPHVAQRLVVSPVPSQADKPKPRLLGEENKKEAKPFLASQKTGGTDTILAGGAVSPVGTVEDMIRSVFGKDADLAIAIAKAESGLRCGAVSHTNKNGTRDHGVFQINDVHMKKFGQKSPYDCMANIKVAYQIFASWEGWHAWSVYNSGRYLSFLHK